METSPLRSRRPKSTRRRIAVQKSIAPQQVAAKFLSSRLTGNLGTGPCLFDLCCRSVLRAQRRLTPGLLFVEHHDVVNVLALGILPMPRGCPRLAVFGHFGRN